MERLETTPFAVVLIPVGGDSVTTFSGPVDTDEPATLAPQPDTVLQISAQSSPRWSTVAARRHIFAGLEDVVYWLYVVKIAPLLFHQPIPLGKVLN